MVGLIHRFGWGVSIVSGWRLAWLPWGLEVLGLMLFHGCGGVGGLGVEVGWGEVGVVWRLGEWDGGGLRGRVEVEGYWCEGFCGGHNKRENSCGFWDVGLKMLSKKSVCVDFLIKGMLGQGGRVGGEGGVVVGWVGGVGCAGVGRWVAFEEVERRSLGEFGAGRRRQDDEGIGEGCRCGVLWGNGR
ncbi:hypothetical protein Tco_0890100 [Tanacetum coccineum]